MAIENIEDLAGAVVQRDEAREGGGREGEGEEGGGAGIKGATGSGSGCGLLARAVGVGCGLWARFCLLLYFVCFYIKDLAFENIEDLAGEVVQRDEARDGGGREGKERILPRKMPRKVRISSNGRICT